MKIANFVKNVFNKKTEIEADEQTTLNEVHADKVTYTFNENNIISSITHYNDEGNVTRIHNYTHIYNTTIEVVDDMSFDGITINVKDEHDTIVYSIIIYNSGFIKITKCALVEFSRDRKDDCVYSTICEIMYEFKNEHNLCDFFEHKVVRDRATGIRENNMVNRCVFIKDARVLPYFKIAIYAWTMSKVAKIVNESKLKEFIDLESYTRCDIVKNGTIPIILFKIPDNMIDELKEVMIQCEEVFKNIMDHFGFKYVMNNVPHHHIEDKYVGFIDIEII